MFGTGCSCSPERAAFAGTRNSNRHSKSSPLAETLADFPAARTATNNCRSIYFERSCCRLWRCSIEVGRNFSGVPIRLAASGCTLCCRYSSYRWPAELVAAAARAVGAAGSAGPRCCLCRPVSSQAPVFQEEPGARSTGSCGCWAFAVHSGRHYCWPRFWAWTQNSSSYPVIGSAAAKAAIIAAVAAPPTTATATISSVAAGTATKTGWYEAPGFARSWANYPTSLSLSRSCSPPAFAGTWLTTSAAAPSSSWQYLHTKLLDTP